MSNLIPSQHRPWRKSTRSQDGNCVEFRDAVNGVNVQIRDTKDRTGPVLTFSATAWKAFVRGGATPQA
ncbi:DUF397 domain-containing protein [Plantactinospora sp. S1510]|uniref:DUF397 domain-containing protein n=1 Tax=Plantactinospora alkalitolerans TaxID=2789879 RepID=A0ABS0H9R4_9ACTN|nr:DUF397 domain-containing protein [Plantactinospora alkalitolerans]MBF9135227.1 DUF397 domain-containing protein [Plantactinospora alkalitolerans]